MLKLSDRKWNSFKINCLFSIKKVIGKPMESYKKGQIPYISTSSVNNGLVGFVESNDISINNAISIDPIKGTAFYHPYKFVGRGFSGASILLLYNSCMNGYNSLFICKMIEQTAKMKASYGNLFNGIRLQNAKIILPIDSLGNPDYDFMEQFIKEREEKKRNEYIDYAKKKIDEIKLTIRENQGGGVEIKSIKVSNIFKIIEKCKCSNASILKVGIIPYVGATNKNNGIMGYCGNDEKVTRGNCIVFVCDGQGSVGYSFYKREKFVGSTTLKVGRFDNINLYNGLYLTTALDKNRIIYSFGYKRTENRLKNEVIMLPIINNRVNYDYMEKYIKDKMIKKYQEYIVYNLK